MAYDAGDGDSGADRLGPSITVLKDRVSLLRPLFVPPDPASRTTYFPGELAKCDLWFRRSTSRWARGRSADRGYW
jgi:hypothetical protein